MKTKTILILGGIAAASFYAWRRFSASAAKTSEPAIAKNAYRAP